MAFDSGEVWVVSTDIDQAGFDDFKNATKDLAKEAGGGGLAVWVRFYVEGVKYALTFKIVEDTIELAESFQGLIDNSNVLIFPDTPQLTEEGNLEQFPLSDFRDVNFGTPPFEDGEIIGIEDNVFFPKGDSFLDDILNGRYEFPVEGELGFNYFLASESSVGLYTPQSASILLNSQENITLELFGGRTGQLPGAINIDIIAEQGIRADLLTDGLSFIPDNSVEEIVTFNPFIPRDAGGTGILDYLPEAARVLEPGGQIIINGTTNNKFTKVKQSLDLESLGLRVVEKQVPLLERFSDLDFRTIDGNLIRKERIKTTILEKI